LQGLVPLLIRDQIKRIRCRNWTQHFHNKILSAFSHQSYHLLGLGLGRDIFWWL